MKYRAIWLGVLTIFVLAGCAGRQVSIDMQDERYRHREDVASAVAELQKNNCMVSIASVVDQRYDKEKLAAGQVEVRGKKSSDWLKRRFMALENIPGQQDRKEVFVDIVVRKVYLQWMPSSLRGSMVIDATYRSDDPMLDVKYSYRGDETGVNWTGGGTEMMSRLNVATNNVINMMAKDLVQVCSQVTMSGGHGN